MTTWQNRIVGSGVKPASDFLAHESNWRIHGKFQQEALEGILDQVGWVQNVIESSRSGKVLDGHLRIILALHRGENTPVPYVQVDVNEKEEALILASLDPISAMATPDAQILKTLLEETSVENEALSILLNDLAQSSIEPLSASTDLNFSEDRSVQIRPVLYVDQIGVFERALRKTGEINRGKALIAVCRQFLGEDADEQG